MRHIALGMLWRLGVESKNDKERRDITEALLQRMADSTTAVRLEAITGVAALGRPADSKLLARVLVSLDLQTKGYNKVLAIWAYTALVNLSTETKIEQYLGAITKFLKHPETNIRSQAAQALGALSKHAKSKVPNLIALLSDKEAIVVHSACMALAQIGASQKVIDALLSTAEKGDVQRATSACMALVQLKCDEQRVLDALIKMLEHKDSDRVILSCITLVNLRANKADVLKAIDKQLERKDLDSRLRPIFKTTIEEIKKPPVDAPKKAARR
jgi:HEAT repeat protein